MEATKFRVNSQNIFLTFPQCPLPMEEALSHLQAICMKKQWLIKEYVIAQEKHSDGNPHLHAWISLNKKVNIGDPALFDISGYHPNM
jgi:hypothetical protein